MRSLGHRSPMGQAALPATFRADAGEHVGEVAFAQYIYLGSDFFTHIIRDLPDP